MKRLFGFLIIGIVAISSFAFPPSGKYYCALYNLQVASETIYEDGHTPKSCVIVVDKNIISIESDNGVLSNSIKVYLTSVDISDNIEIYKCVDMKTMSEFELYVVEHYLNGETFYTIRLKYDYCSEVFTIEKNR